MRVVLQDLVDVFLTDASVPHLGDNVLQDVSVTMTTILHLQEQEGGDGKRGGRGGRISERRVCD